MSSVQGRSRRISSSNNNSTGNTKSLVEFCCRDNDRIYFEASTKIAREFSASSVAYCLDQLPVSSVQSYLINQGAATGMSRETAAVEATLRDRRSHFGLDGDTGRLEITPAVPAAAAARRHALQCGHEVRGEDEHRPCTLASHGECLRCRERLRGHQRLSRSAWPAQPG